MRQLAELEHILGLMVVEHRKLLGHLDAHQAALRAFQVDRIEDLTVLQEASRLRIATLETKRRNVNQQIARLLRHADEPTLTKLAELFPHRAKALIEFRDQLRDAVAQVQSRTSLSGRVAGAVLGHLNTAVRLLAGAVEQAGVYTKQGTPRVANRIGALEAVG
jgi:hypothetical protein